MHQELICFYSPYFKAAFKGGFQEATTGEVVLDDVDAEVFGLFVQWLYTQDIMDPDSSTTGETIKKQMPSTTHLIELWLLAEYLQVPKLQNYVLKVIKEREKPLDLQNESFHILYERTESGSILRKFFVDLLCWSSMSGQTVLKMQHAIPSEMILDMLVLERDRRVNNIKRDPLENMSNYDASRDLDGEAD